MPVALQWTFVEAVICDIVSDIECLIVEIISTVLLFIEAIFKAFYSPAYPVVSAIAHLVHVEIVIFKPNPGLMSIALGEFLKGVSLSFMIVIRIPRFVISGLISFGMPT